MIPHGPIAKSGACVDDSDMYHPPPGFQTVFQSKHRQKCLELGLVLESVGIASKSVHHEQDWVLIVRESDADRSAEELSFYGQENPDCVSISPEPPPVLGGAWTGVSLYAAIVMTIAVLMATSAFGFDWMSAGRMQAGLVKEGQWWRTFTALTLHLDVGHLGSNLVFGIVFGILAGRALGGGVAWLVIVLAGALGNRINAMVQVAEHASIGASTAVFAALGVIVSHALRPSHATNERTLKRWSPLIGGVLLLAFTGIGGERTDVTAHVTGFLAGLVLGWGAAALPSAWLTNHRFQQAAGVGAVLIVALAWAVALSAATVP